MYKQADWSSGSRDESNVSNLLSSRLFINIRCLFTADGVNSYFIKFISGLIGLKKKNSTKNGKYYGKNGRKSERKSGRKNQVIRLEG